MQRTPSRINTKIICRYSNCKQKKQREKKWSNKPEEEGARIRITSDFSSNHVKSR